MSKTVYGAIAGTVFAYILTKFIRPKESKTKVIIYAASIGCSIFLASRGGITVFNAFMNEIRHSTFKLVSPRFIYQEHISGLG